MRRTILAATAVVALAVSGVGSALADDRVTELVPQTPFASAETGLTTDETSPLWFVELASPPTAAGTALATVRAEKASFRSAARKAGLNLTERYAFDRLWNGLSVRIEPGDVAQLSRLSGVKALYPVVTEQIPQTEASTPELATALAMTGADVAQSELGYTGQGVKVAVMDTGVDYDHPDLGGAFGPGSRVTTGYDFVGDAFNADPASPAYNPVTAPDEDPDDCNGHGTHVAGIVGANGAVVGVAPEVTFGAYRVFGCEGSTTTDIMIAAMERVLMDDMDVLNMSIGSAFQWPQYPTAQAADRLVDKGVSVVASIGNSGANGLYAAGAPGLGKKVIGVASFDNTHASINSFTVSPADLTVGYTNATAAPPAPTSGSLPLAKTGTPTTADDACAPLEAGSLVGQAALIRRGTCSFYTKALNAQNAGAAAVVLYNNAAGRISPTVAGTPSITIPVVAVSGTEGVALDAAIAAETQNLTWSAQAISVPNATGGFISSSSSYGLSPDLELKPDLGAPGGLIRSTYPLEKGEYATISGTSMASPHVAGAAALLLQAKPKTSTQAIRGILQNSADPKVWWGNPGLGFLDNVHRQGAGMLDIDDAILSQSTVLPSKIATGESEAGPFTQTLTVRNTSSNAVTYSLSHVAALSTGPNTHTPAFFTGFASADFSAPTVTVPAKSSATLDVTITANPTLPLLSQYGGYVVLTPDGGGAPLRVPYAGITGDYQSKQVLTPGTFGLPLVGRQVTPGSYEPTPQGEVFTMTGLDMPSVLAHLDHQAEALRIEVYAAGSGKSWGRAFDERYVARNSTSTSFFAYTFDGTTTSGKKTLTVPNGDYYVVLSVLKANGDKDNPAHWERWPSPTFTIARP